MKDVTLEVLQLLQSLDVPVLLPEQSRVPSQYQATDPQGFMLEGGASGLLGYLAGPGADGYVQIESINPLDDDGVLSRYLSTVTAIHRTRSGAHDLGVRIAAAILGSDGDSPGHPHLFAEPVSPPQAEPGPGNDLFISRPSFEFTLIRGE